MLLLPQVTCSTQLFQLYTWKALSEQKAHAAPLCTFKYLNLLTRIKESGFKDNVKASPPEMLRDSNRKASKNAGQLKNMEKSSFLLFKLDR